MGLIGYDALTELGAMLGRENFALAYSPKIKMTSRNGLVKDH